MGRPKKFPPKLKSKKFICLACNGKGQVFDGQTHWTCEGCKGKGYIVQ